MFTKLYKVTSPKVIEEFIDSCDLDSSKVLVKIEYMAICRADIRYFLGSRDKNVLDHKYPLSPIHEAVGEVIKDPTSNFKKGDKVILIPTFCEEDELKKEENKRCLNKELGENYCLKAKFRSSSCDGFMREFIAIEPKFLVKYDKNIKPSVAVFSELLSVGECAIRRINFTDTKRVAIFGDGIMGYIVYTVLKAEHPEVDITLFGVNEKKMETFKDIKTTKFENYKGDKFNTLIEAVGGRFSSDAINNMIDIATPGADLILMGVSEDKIPINTRLVLERGLTLKGVTRSNREDFINVSKILNDKETQKRVEVMVLSETKIETIADIYKCYDLDINNKETIGKHILKW